jgi:hypothetical protein
MNFWDAIPIERRGKAYADLAILQAERYCQMLAPPPGLRGEPLPPAPPIIDAPHYLEEEEIGLEQEVARAPESEEHMKET